MQNPKRLMKKEFLNNGKSVMVQKRTANSFALHSHDYFEIEIVLRGSGEQYINSKRYDIKRGNIYLLTPADFHDVKYFEEAEIINISFDETVPSKERLLNIYGGGTVNINVGDDILSRLEKAAELLIAECENGDVIEPLMEYIFEHICKKEQKNEEITSIRRAIIYIENHFRDDPTLEESARQACLSPVYFGNLFKKTTGQTYVEYLNNCKLNCAKMLLESGMSVSRACFDSGFGSLSGFLYVFKQKNGISPNEYRKKHLKK